jgi:hypothetical protein
LEHHATTRPTKRTDNPKRGFNQAALEAFLVTPLFPLLPKRDTRLRDFSTFLIISSEAFPAKTQSMSFHIQGKPPLNWPASQKAL